MGTSNSYDGPNVKTPLVPSWLEPNDGSPNGEKSKPNDPQSVPIPPERPPIPPNGDPDRFKSARTNYTRFAGSGGRDGASLKRAVSNYVSRASGGARKAAQRMGAARATSAKLTFFLSTLATQGVQQVLKVLNLENLAGRPIEEVFLGLMDYLSPDGGTIDEGIAREAFIETIADLGENGITNLDGMTSEQIQTVFELYVTHSIEARLCNDIGTKTIILPKDFREIANVQAQLRDFIRRGVSDAINQARTAFHTLTSQQVQQYVDLVYEQAFSILQAIGEEGDVA